MNSSVPDLLTQGDPARLFPVLADTSKEAGRHLFFWLAYQLLMSWEVNY